MTAPSIDAIVAAYGARDTWEVARIAKAAEPDGAIVDLCRLMRDRSQRYS